jgi:hypothetical protein
MPAQQIKHSITRLLLRLRRILILPANLCCTACRDFYITSIYRGGEFHKSLKKTTSWLLIDHHPRLGCQRLPLTLLLLLLLLLWP